MLTQARLKELLHYDPSTGDFTWIGGSRTPIGKRAGCLFDTGYIRIQIAGRFYRAHRLAWLYVTGAWPRHQIDHIDGQRDNNAFHNLRDVTAGVNSQNRRKAHPGSASGLLGVAKGYKGQWNAYITAAGRSQYLGTYQTANEAHAAYLAAKRRMHEGCTL